MHGGENMVEENGGNKHNDWKDVFKNFVELVDKAGDFYDIKVFLNDHTEEVEKTYEWEDDEYTFLHCAAVRGNLELLKELVENRKVYVDIKTGKKGKTPLLMAIREGHLEVVKELVNGGANVHKEDGQGAGALHYAAMSGQLEVFKEVATIVNDAGEYSPKKDKNGFNLLHLAVLSGSEEQGLESVESSVVLANYILKEYGTTMLTEETSRGMTPLQLAANKRNLPMVESFMKHDAFKTIGADKKYSAIRIARKRGPIK